MFGRVIESESDTTESKSDDDEDDKRIRNIFKYVIKSNP